MGPELKRKLDYSDYLATPDDGKRYEIVEGELYVTPAPSGTHQRISGRLERQIADFFHARSLGEMLHAPIDVILTSGDIVQPDIVVVSNPLQVSKRGIEGAPLLVAEILSPSTRERDQGLKARRYAELGVQHYWIVDPEARRLDCYRLEAGAFKHVAQAEGDAELEHPAWEGLALDLAALWRQP